MDEMSYLDAIAMFIEKAHERFEQRYMLDPDLYSVFMEKYKVLGEFITKHDVDETRVDINDETLEISLIVKCYEITTNNNNTSFYDLLSVCESCGFEASDDDKVLARFTFEGVWKIY